MCGPHFASLDRKSVFGRNKIFKAAVIAVVIAAILTVIGVVSANAVTSGPRSITAYSCENSTRTLKTVLTEHQQTCPTGMTEVSVGGVAGPRGPQGPAGATGATGPSGFVETAVVDLGAVPSVATGGPFVTNATQVGTVFLAAGTYIVTVNAKATPPSGGTGAVNEFPQFFLYNQPANASFAGDLLNVGAGPLEAGANSNIDSYYSGTGIVTLTSATTLHLYAFGYNDNRGSDTYVLDDATVTVALLKTS